ncbi:MAG TPA: hypothetical protein VGI92_04395 [Gemmatimonadales bacterium]|jgi:phage terminase Nu1 subunit (DNA packaging protein)
MGGPDAIVGLGFCAMLAIVSTNVARAISGRVGRKAHQQELNAMRDEIDQLHTELEHVQTRLADVDDLQGRLDFAERMLGQLKSGGALPGGRS